MFVGWLKADGATIHAGEPLFTLEGEKATEDIEGFDNGILHIPADGPRKGDIVLVGAVIGFLLQAGEPIPAASKPAAAPRQGGSTVVGAKATASPVPHADRPASSPRARRTAAKLGIDWRDAKGTGRNGRIRERDILALAAAPSTAPGRSTAPRHRGAHGDQPPLHGSRHAHDDDRCNEPGHASQAMEDRVEQQRRPRSLV